MLTSASLFSPLQLSEQDSFSLSIMYLGEHPFLTQIGASDIKDDETFTCMFLNLSGLMGMDPPLRDLPPWTVQPSSAAGGPTRWFESLPVDSDMSASLHNLDNKVH